MTREVLEPPWDVGPYRLDVRLARGGMGEVYQAWDPRLERQVAVKRLLGDPDRSVRERFRREAKILARLDHPAIVQVFDLLEDTELWIVMELVDGPTLSELLRHAPLDVDRVIDDAHQIASALAAAHQAGIIHRDLKTDNVMVSRPSRNGPIFPDRIKLLDFGVATKRTPGPAEGSRPTEHTETLSAPQALMGTPRAMSPEQARGEELTPRSDLFSLGALIYELLTRRSPFGATSVAETLIRVTTHRPPPVRELDPAIPETLSALVDQLLEKAPERRPESAAAVVETLRALTSPIALRRPRNHPCPSPAPIGTPPTVTPVDHEAVKTLLAFELLGAPLVLELGDRDAASFFRRHRRRMRDLLALHDGLELERSTVGLLAFGRPLPAVRFALAYRDAARQLADETGLDCHVRLAIHLGEVILRRNSAADVARGAPPLEVEGLAKLTTRELIALAARGQTLLTPTAYEMARRAAVGQPDPLEWISHGVRTRGLAQPLEVFEVRFAQTNPRPPSDTTRSGRPVPAACRRLTDGSDFRRSESQKIETTTLSAHTSQEIT